MDNKYKNLRVWITILKTQFVKKTENMQKTVFSF